MDGSCYAMMDCCVMCWKEGCWVKEQEEEEDTVNRQRNNVLEKKNNTDLKKAAGDRSEQ